MQPEADFTALQSRVMTRLGAAGIDDAQMETRLLLAHVFGDDAWQKVADHAGLDGLTKELAELETLVAQRCHRKPLSQLLGTKGFWTLDLKVTEDVLTPRADTEALVAALLELTRDKKTGTMVDLGTGSGAILLAFLSERLGWTGVGVDISPAALAVAQANAAQHDLHSRCRFECASWTEFAETGFDLVASNPPYIETGEIAELDPEVREHEPILALDGGTDGLDCYREIVRLLPRWGRPGAVFGFEIGWQQAKAVQALLQETATELAVHKDLGGRDRVVSGRLKHMKKTLGMTGNAG